jgi:hypothetical protein
MTPHRFWKVGERRTLPNGRVLETSNADSFWSYQEQYEGPARNFFKVVEQIADRLMPNKALLHDISAAGGKCEMYVLLPGIKNIGDSLVPSTLKQLAELGIFLSIEVFQKWKNAAGQLVGAVSE